MAAIARERRSVSANGMLNYAVQHASPATVQQAIAAYRAAHYTEAHKPEIRHLSKPPNHETIFEPANESSRTCLK